MDFLVDFQNLSSRDGEKKGVARVEQDRKSRKGAKLCPELASLSNQLLITGLRTRVVCRDG